MTWYGPNDTWPPHPAQVWRDALVLARDAGWQLCRFAGKNWGRVCCRRDDEACSVLIFTTGRATENVARDLPKKIRRCPHGFSGELGIRQMVQNASDRLADAESIMDAVEVIANAWDAAARAAELFDAIDTAVADAQTLADQAVAQATAADAARAAGEDVLRALLPDVGPTPGGALDVVAKRLGEVEDEVDGVAAAGASLRTLRERIDGARQRVGQLRRRLGG